MARFESIVAFLSAAMSAPGKRTRDVADNTTALSMSSAKLLDFPSLPTPDIGSSMGMAEAGEKLEVNKDPTRSSLKWIARLRRLLQQSKLPSDCYYLSDLSLTRKDLECSAFSTSDVNWYKGFIARIMACSKLAARYLLNKRSEQLRSYVRGSQSSSNNNFPIFTVPDEDDCKRFRTFLLEADLTDQNTRMLDWKAQEIYRLLVAYVSLQTRSRRAAELASATVANDGRAATGASPEAQVYALDIAERGMLQALAWTFELRSHYIFHLENLAIGLCSLNGSRPILIKNRELLGEDEFDLAIIRMNGRPTGRPVSDFGERSGPFLLPEVIPPPLQKPSTVAQSSSSHPDAKTASARLEKWHSQGVNACVRWSVKEGNYVVYFETHQKAEERNLELRKANGFQNMRRDSASSSIDNNYAHMSAFAETEARLEGFDSMAPVLVRSVPTTFFMVGERKALLACIESIIGILDIVARTTDGYEKSFGVTFQNVSSSDFLYFGKAHGTLSVADFLLYRFPSAVKEDMVLAVLPCLVLKNLQAVRLMAFHLGNIAIQTLPKQAAWLYPSGEAAKAVLKDTPFGNVYKDGYNFHQWQESFNQLQFEFHPGYSFFQLEAQRVVDTHRYTAARRIRHQFDGTKNCMRDLLLRRLYRFAEEYPSLELPEYTLLVPLEDLDHSPVIPKTGPISEDPLYGSGPAGCTFSACNTLSSECRNGAGCMICARDLDVIRIGKRGREFVMMTYKEIAAWQYSLSLRNVRNLLLRLDEDALQQGKKFATIEDLDAWVSREANLGTLWSTLKKDMISHLRDLEGFHSQMLANYSKMHVTVQRGRGAGMVDRRLIRQIMSDYIEDFCNEELGGITGRDSRTVKLGDSRTFVFIDAEGGNFHDFKTAEKGNIFDLVVRNVFKSSGVRVKDEIGRAVDYCHNWLIKKNGPDFVKKWEQKQASRTSESNIKQHQQQQPHQRNQDSAAGKQGHDAGAMMKDPSAEARRVWQASRRITKESFEAGYVATAVNYLKLRGIHEERLLFDNACMRYNPACPVAEGTTSMYQNPALVFAVSDPRVKQQQPEILGIQAIFLDSSTNRKAEDLLDVQKKSRGAVGGHACRVQSGSNGIAALQEFNALIAIGEGPETMLSVAQACPELDVYCTLSISNIGNFPYVGDQPWGVGIIYCADNDVGDTAEKQAIKDKTVMDNVNKLRAKGYTVLRCLPPLIGGKSTDFNDVLLASSDPDIACIKIRNILKQAQAFAPTSPDPNAVKQVELTDDGKHIKPLPKVSERDPAKRKAQLMEEIRKRNEAVADEEPPKEKSEPVEKKKKVMLKNKKKKKPPTPSSSSSSSESDSSSSSSSASSSSSSDSEIETPKKTKVDDDGTKKKSRLKKMSASTGAAEIDSIDTKGTESAQGSGSAPSSPQQLAEKDQVEESAVKPWKRSAVIEDN